MVIIIVIIIIMTKNNKMILTRWLHVEFIWSKLNIFYHGHIFMAVIITDRLHVENLYFFFIIIFLTKYIYMYYYNEFVNIVIFLINFIYHILLYICI